MRFPFRWHTEAQLGRGFVGKCFHKGVRSYHKRHTLHGWTLAGGQALGNNKCAGQKITIFPRVGKRARRVFQALENQGDGVSKVWKSVGDLGEVMALLQRDQIGKNP